jgi:hypothetical protein
MAAVWERSADGGISWEHWMDMRFERGYPDPESQAVSVMP